VIKPGHQFGRIHRDDIARAVVAAMRQDPPPGRRVFNLADDTPAESAVVVEQAAALLSAPLPPACDFADIEGSMSPLARSFWAENRKVSSQKTKATLGIEWLYPSYREGLRSILAEEAREGRP
jgi:nucleoside-diphosphate-sugar epimerase